MQKDSSLALSMTNRVWLNNIGNITGPNEKVYINVTNVTQI